MPLFGRNGKCHSTKELDGKTAIITGCNSGLGKEAAKDFYRRGAKVIMACRNLDKANKAKAEIQNACKDIHETSARACGIIKVAKCDLASMISIREFAKHILDTEPQIDILVNNAGVMMCPYTQTEDGFEMQMGTNHLGHFLLTMLLLPRFKNSTPARIVTVAAHAMDVLHLDDLNYKNTPYKPIEAYAQSKLANIMFSRELAAKLKEHNIEGVNTYSLNPGISETQITRYINKTLFRRAKPIYKVFFGPFMKSAEQGAQTTIYCSVDDKCAGETGLFYSDCKVTPLHGKAVDDNLSKILWDASMELVGLKDTDPFTTPDSGVIYSL